MIEIIILVVENNNNKKKVLYTDCDMYMLFTVYIRCPPLPPIMCMGIRELCSPPTPCGWVGGRAGGWVGGGGGGSNW